MCVCTHACVCMYLVLHVCRSHMYGMYNWMYADKARAPHLRYHVTLLCDPHPVNHFSVKVAPEVNLARMQVKTSPATLVTALGMHLAGMILPSDAVSRRVYVYLCVCVCVCVNICI